jgi:hypothetical protein
LILTIAVNVIVVSGGGGGLIITNLLLLYNLKSILLQKTAE